MKKHIAKVALKNTKTYLILLVILSIVISYLTFLISMNVKYAIDGILFNNYNDVPKCLKVIFRQNYIQNLLIYKVFFKFIFIFNLNFVVILSLKYFNNFSVKFRIVIIIAIINILNLEYESYNSYDKAEMMQRINEDSEVYSKFFNNQFNVILDIIFLSIFIIRKGSGLNFQISIYIFLSIIVMILFSLWYFKKLSINIENMIVNRKRLLNETINNINNFKFVRVFNKQDEEKQKYKQLNDFYCKEEVKFIKLVLFYDIILEHITYLKTPIIYVLGGISIIKRKNNNGFISCFT